MASQDVRRSTIRISVGLLIALMLLSAVAGPVRAAVVDRGTFTDDWAFDYQECGLTFEVEGSSQGWYRIRQGRSPHAETAFFELSRFTWHETHSASNGVTITMGGTATSNEVRGTHVEGSIYLFEVVVAGRLFTVWDADGRAIFRERGQHRITYRFDTHGDDVPGGTFLGVVEEDWRGLFPELDCSVLE